MFTQIQLLLGGLRMDDGRVIHGTRRVSMVQRRVVDGGDVGETSLRHHEVVLRRSERGAEPILVEDDAVIPPATSD